MDEITTDYYWAIELKEVEQQHLNIKHHDPLLFGMTVAEANEIRLEFFKEKLLNCQNDQNRWFKISCEEANNGCIRSLMNDNAKEMASLEKKIYFYSGKPSKQYIDLEMVKEIPIIDIMPSKPVRAGVNTLFYNCIFHDEKTPSMVVYKDRNRFKCFGCGQYGSVVDIYMKLNNCTFAEAVRGLK